MDKSQNRVTGSQKGSILVGVMALSIAMTLAAGSFLLMTANIATQGTGETSKQQLLYAAETGMYMGITWTRNYPALKVKDPNWIAPPKLPLTLTTGPGGFDQINGYKVKVIIETTPPAMGLGYMRINSFATKGPHFDTLKISQLITGSSDVIDPLFLSSSTIANWSDSLIAGH